MDFVYRKVFFLIAEHHDTNMMTQLVSLQQMNEQVRQVLSSKSIKKYRHSSQYQHLIELDQE